MAFLVLLVGGLGGLALVWRGSERAIHPPAGGDLPKLGDYPELVGEAVVVSSSTGARLSGHFFAGRSTATVVLTHGYGGREAEMLPVAASLHAAGLSVFTYDLRGCGSSTGAVTFGALEARDLVSIVDRLSQRRDVGPIGAFGFSMGGSATILAAAADPRIQAVVADSAWADIRHWVRDRILRRPDNRFSTLALRLAELRTGTSFRRLRPVDAIASIAPRPLLLVHGTEDEVVPVADAHADAAAAGPTATLWAVRGAGHEETVRAGGASTSPRIAAFFEESLRVERAA